MADITTTSLLEEELSSLSNSYQFLKNLSLDNPAFKYWYYTGKQKLGYERLRNLNVIFIGQTGYGKSSLINKLISQNVFETSDYEACTKRLQSADFFLHHKKKSEQLAYVLSFVDLPGIGENDQADDKYLKWYQDYLKEAHVIVYLFRADKRDHTQDEFFFNNVFHKEFAKNLICVVSQADKIEPLSRGNELSKEQLNNLDRKISDIKNKDFLTSSDLFILPISTHLDFNINNLENMICQKLKNITQ